jgi:hypothetical protein
VAGRAGNRNLQHSSRFAYQLVTHNVGNVDSIGTVIYLAGEERFACPQATFMLHGVSFQTPTTARNLAHLAANPPGPTSSFLKRTVTSGLFEC